VIRSNFADIFGSRNPESWAIVWCCLRDPTFSRFDIIPACDGQTDGQTDGWTGGHMTTANTALCDSITSRGKKWSFYSWKNYKQVATLMVTTACTNRTDRSIVFARWRRYVPCLIHGSLKHSGPHLALLTCIAGDAV